MMLLFYVGENRYAIENKFVTKIFPHVNLKKSKSSPPSIAGMMNWQGNLIPVFDFCQLIEGREASDSFHTRIIVVHGISSKNHVGLLAEKVIDIIDPSSELLSKDLPIIQYPFIRKFMNDERGTLQLIDIESLIHTLSKIYAQQDIPK